MQGRIIKIVSNQYTVLCGDEAILCVAMGKVRKQGSPYVGDIVEIQKFDDKYGIEKILPRSNSMIRPQVANVDQLLIVMSAKDPDFSETLVDRITFLSAHANIKTCLCISKMDLADESINPIIEKYKKLMDVVVCEKGHLDKTLSSVLENKITVLTGQSGVGKSSLLNEIDPTFKLQTQEISKALGRGKHTTRHCELHNVGNGWVCDTPGFSSLDFNHMDKEDLAYSVIEFRPYLSKCKFRDCKHVHEPGCQVKMAVEAGEIAKSRYENYLQVLELIENRKVKY